VKFKMSDLVGLVIAVSAQRRVRRALGPAAAALVSVAQFPRPRALRLTLRLATGLAASSGPMLMEKKSVTLERRSRNGHSH
jgi:hypothetical protein